MRSRSSATPAGMPVTMTVSCGPCDSPAVVKVKRIKIYPEVQFIPSGARDLRWNSDSVGQEEVVKNRAEIIPVAILLLNQRHPFRASPRLDCLSRATARAKLGKHSK